MKEHLWTRASAGLFDVSHMGQVRLRAEVGRRGGRGPRARGAGAGRHPRAWRGPPALCAVHQRRGRHPRRPDGREPGRSPVRRGQRRLQGRRHRAYEGASCRDLRGSADCRPRAVWRCRDRRPKPRFARLAPAAADMRFMDVATPRLERRRTLGLALGLHRRGRLRDLGARRPRRGAGRGACWRWTRSRPSASARAIRSGSRPGSASTAPTSTPRPRRSRRRSTGRSRRPAAGAASAKAAFPARTCILGELETGAPRRRVGLLPEGRAPMRAGTEVSRRGDTKVGEVTSGAFGPSLEGPMSMGYVATEHAATGTQARRRGARQAPARHRRRPAVPALEFQTLSNRERHP